MQEKATQSSGLLSGAYAWNSAEPPDTVFSAPLKSSLPPEGIRLTR